jgi:5'-3' exonuclease
MYHASEGEEQSSAKRKTLGFVRDKFGEFDAVKVAVDCPPYDRKQIYPEYKANRPERPIALVEELKQCQEALLKDGWNLLTCQGAEADDIIATYCAENYDSESITIYGTDKDLLQIMASYPDVRLFDAFNNKFKTADTTLGVPASQVVDILALDGDKSDNVPGLKGVGVVTARKVLAEYPSIDELLSAAKNPDNKDKFKPAFLKNLLENEKQLLLSYQLVTLNYNCEIVETEGEKKSMETEAEVTNEELIDNDQSADEAVPYIPTVPVGEAQAIQIAAPQHEAVSFKQSLEPVGVPQLKEMAKYLFDSGLYSNFRNGQSVMAAIMSGRELGLGAVAGLSSINIIKGKPTMSAQAMLALILASGKAEFFDCMETSNTISTFVTKRVGARSETKLSFTIQEAEAMGVARNDNWKKQPATMLRWRAVTTLGRMVYPDVILGVYSQDEMDY